MPHRRLRDAAPVGVREQGLHRHAPLSAAAVLAVALGAACGSSALNAPGADGGAPDGSVGSGGAGDPGTGGAGGPGTGGAGGPGTGGSRAGGSDEGGASGSGADGGAS